VDAVAYAATGSCSRCRVDAACALTRWQHFSVWDDVIAANLKVWHHVKNLISSIDVYIYMYLKNDPSKFFIPIRFQTTET